MPTSLLKAEEREEAFFSKCSAIRERDKSSSKCRWI
jgi:hypothetical protein